MVTRTKLHSSSLIRCLADLDMADAVDAGDEFAQRLGQWVNFADAITLSNVHNDGGAGLKKNPADAQYGSRAAALLADFERIQALLANSITNSCSPKPAKARMKSHISLPEPIAELPMNFATAYPPYRRFYEAHHRDMEMGIQPLRVNVREALATASPRLKKLAELDETLENILREREKFLLSKVATLLRKRFEKLFKEHQQKLAETGEEDNPSRWMHTGGWLARFCSEMQMLLLAELDLRLQPTMGLIEAFKQNTQ